MTVPNKPFWLSQANSEFGGNGWASSILSKAGLSVPRWAGDLAGKSSSITMNLTIGMYGQNAGFATVLHPYGDLSPRTNPILGGEVISCMSSPYMYQDLTIQLAGGVVLKAFTLTIPGLTTRSYDPDSASIPGNVWMALDMRAWLAARNGQTIQLVFTAA